MKLQDSMPEISRLRQGRRSSMKPCRQRTWTTAISWLASMKDAAGVQQNEVTWSYVARMHVAVLPFRPMQISCVGTAHQV